MSFGSRVIDLSNDIILDITDPAMDRLTEEGFHPEFGARPLKRVIQKRVLNELSKQLLTRSIEPGGSYLLDVFTS